MSDRCSLILKPDLRTTFFRQLALPEHLMTSESSCRLDQISTLGHTAKPLIILGRAICAVGRSGEGMREAKLRGMVIFLMDLFLPESTDG